MYEVEFALLEAVLGPRINPDNAHFMVWETRRVRFGIFPPMGQNMDNWGLYQPGTNTHGTFAEILAIVSDKKWRESHGFVRGDKQ